MAKQIISRGTSANDGTGDNLREGANKINLNFNEIYTAIGDGTTIDGTIKIADDSSTVMTLSANGETTRILGGTGITSTISSNDLTLALDTSLVLTASGSSTLTNKTLALGSNTVSGTLAQFNTAVTDATLVSTTGSETLTNKTINASQLVDGSVSNAKLTNSSITMIDDSSTTDAVALGENFRFTGGTGIASTLGSNAVTFAIDATVATLSGSQTLTNKTIVAGNNTISGITNAMLSGSAGITNANLANSSITLGDDTISLGGTDTSIANLSLTGATGTIDLTSSGNKIRFNFANTGSFPTASTYEGMFAYDIGGNKAYVADAGGWVKLIDENGSIADLANVGSIASITNGQALIWNSGAGRFDPGAVGGDVVDDTTPQLGGDLDAQGNDVQDTGYVSHRSPDATVTQTLTVTVATKTTEHTAYGDGSSSGYLIDGHEGAHLQLTPGVYKFDQADSSNSSHPLRFYDTAGKNAEYTTNVTTAGTPGSSGAYTQITITKATPSTLHYQCSSHANMGGVVSVVGSEHPRITETLGLGGTLNFTGGGLNIEDGYAYGYGDNTYRIEGKDDGVNARIGFVTAGSEAMRITSDGDLSIGSTTTTEQLHVKGRRGLSRPTGTHRVIEFYTNITASTSAADLFTATCSNAHSSFYYEIIVNGSDWSGHSAARTIKRGFHVPNTTYTEHSVVESSGPHANDITYSYSRSSNTFTGKLTLDTGGVGLNCYVKLVGMITSYTVAGTE